MGFDIRINLYSTHGDYDYIGLNGLEMFDECGRNLTRREDNPENFPFITAEPFSVNTLPGMEKDPRTPDKLIDGHNDTGSDLHMWLAPYINTGTYAARKEQTRVPNYVRVFFERPVAISRIRLWNYRKNPRRGVREFEVIVDDKMVYRGYMDRSLEPGELGGGSM